MAGRRRIVVGISGASGAVLGIRALEMLRNKREALPPKKHGNIPL